MGRAAVTLSQRGRLWDEGRWVQLRVTHVMGSDYETRTGRIMASRNKPLLAPSGWLGIGAASQSLPEDGKPSPVGPRPTQVFVFGPVGRLQWPPFPGVIVTRWCHMFTQGPSCPGMMPAWESHRGCPKSPIHVVRGGDRHSSSRTSQSGGDANSLPVFPADREAQEHCLHQESAN